MEVPTAFEADAIRYEKIKVLRSIASLDPKQAHGQVAMVKLFASEMVGRVADGALQIFAGRGYMRENPVERLWRDRILRLPTVW